MTERAGRAVEQDRCGELGRILFILPFAPSLDARDGGNRAITALLSATAMRREIHVIFPAFDNRPPVNFSHANCARLTGVPAAAPKATRLQKYARLFTLRDPDWAIEVRTVPLAEAIAQLVKSQQFDVIHCEFHVMAQYLPVLASYAPNALRIVTEHEPGICSGKGAPHSRTGIRRLLDWLDRMRWARYEKRYLPLADAVVTFTDGDRAALRKLLGPDGPPIEIVPLRVPSITEAPLLALPETSCDLLFFGNFDHPPNIEAATRLARDLFPRLSANNSELSITIVGPNPPAELVALGGPRIRITGAVDHIAPWLAGAKLIVAPLSLGGGTRVKVLEALAAGRPVLASPLAVAGLSVQGGRECEIADSDDDFVRLALELLADDERRDRLGAAAREWAERELDQQRWLNEFDGVYLRARAVRSGRDCA